MMVHCGLMPSSAALAVADCHPEVQPLECVVIMPRVIEPPSRPVNRPELNFVVKLGLAPVLTTWGEAVTSVHTVVVEL